MSTHKDEKYFRGSTLIDGRCRPAFSENTLSVCAPKQSGIFAFRLRQSHRLPLSEKLPSQNVVFVYTDYLTV